ncbi:hypothetical protein CFB46_01190 [Burkholderia sp. HI2761]|nr:hypothetical protein CFB46_01190 [Burkholderia sp. HI2761]
MIVLRDVQVGTDEHPLAGELAGGDQVGKTLDLAHVEQIEVVDGERGFTLDVRGLPRKGAGCGRGWRFA